MKKFFIYFTILCAITIIALTSYVAAMPDCNIFNRSGCCSRHGGVCGCNKEYGKLKCCDGTLSASCSCNY